MTKLAIHGCLLAVALSTSALAQQAQPAPGVEVGTASIGTPSLLGRGEESSIFARGELVTGQMAHGIAQGVLLTTVLHSTDVRAWAGITLLGAAVGGGGAFLATWKGISSGPAEAINNGTVWGFADAFLLWPIINPTGDATLAMFMLSGLAGTGVGAGVGLLLHPTSGQVAMVNSGSVWLGLLALGFVAPFWTSATSSQLMTMELLTTHLGMVGLSVLASRYPISRGRMFLIDAGGVVGGLLGLVAIAFLPPKDWRLVGPYIGTGVLLGLGTVAFFSRGLDAPAAPAVSLMPMVTEHGGFGLMAGATF